ncbi:MAG: hemerythrin domain-containing protein [Bacteroidota bacterium]|jgi:hypothetical protein
MNGEVYSFFVNDHRRLETLLKLAVVTAEEINNAAYSEFRSGLLKHIGMEEKILLPAIKWLQNGLPYQLAGTLRLEHGAFAALLIPPASRKITAVLHTIMNHHNELEEGEDGLYAVCDRLVGNHIQELMKQVRSFPDVPVMPHIYNPNVLDVTRRAVARAGYDFDKIEI